MWREFFYFSKAQQAGLFVLLGSIIVVLSVWVAQPFLVSKTTVSKNADFDTQVAKFRHSLQEQETQRLYEYKKSGYKRAEYPEKEMVEVYSFPFNPNTLDSAGFAKLGIRNYVISNILKYRAKGGVFRTDADFEKIYGVTQEQFIHLQPFIDLPQEPVSEKRDSLAKAEPVFVELNSADTTELKKIRGIGSGYAKGIVAYRNLLGGYISTEQLLEVRNMTPEAFAKIEPFVFVDTLKIRKIDVNKASIDKLRNHPYLNFYNARAILEYRQNNRKINSPNELRGLYELPEDVLEKMLPYLEFR